MKKLLTLVPVFFLMFFSCRSVKWRSISTTGAPKAIGPYSQAVRTGNLIYTAGQIGIVPETNAFAVDDIAAQTHQALKNINAVLKASGSDMALVVKVTVFMKDLNDFAKMNDIYKEYFPGIAAPARSTVQVARLPKDALIEIECVATTL
ncbi:MAG: endoribonuclease [Flavipsychrobacter sp.]|jgi:2-iminobutanoate/2-iminopropanoate deaminase|nr:endoribonuclease [Flavipsychrobacter sp.]